MRKECEDMRARGLVPNPWVDPTWHGKLFRTKLWLKRWFSFRSWNEWLFYQVLSGRMAILGTVINFIFFVSVLYIAYHFIQKYW